MSKTTPTDNEVRPPARAAKDKEAWGAGTEVEEEKLQDAANNGGSEGMSAAEEYEKGKRLIPKLQFWNLACFWLALFGAVMMVVELELSRLQADNIVDVGYEINAIIKGCTSLSTLLLLFSINRYWHVKIEVFKVKHLVHDSATVWSVPDFKRAILIEFLVCSFHIPPYVDQAIGPLYTNLHSNALGCFMFLRLYMLPRIIKQHFKSNYVSHKVRIIGAINKVPFNNLFVIKASLTLHPYSMLMGALLTYVLVSAFCYEVTEQQIPICNSGPDVDPDICHPPGTYYWRWVVFAFALILGIEPKTVPLTKVGQSLTIVGALVGTILLATLIAVVAQTLTLSNTESRVVDQIRTRALTEAVKDKAVRFIQKYWRFVIHVKKEARKKGGNTEKSKLTLKVDGDIDGDGKVDPAERRAKEGLIHALHQWRVMKRKGKEESQLTTLSKDVSTVLDDVSHLKSWSSETNKKVEDLKTSALDEISKVSEKLDKILNKL
jgi:hypothetical protein|eukprot:g8262.t1